MATILTYGNAPDGITLDDIQTVDFTQKPVLTDDKTQYLWDEYHIKTKALFNLDLSPSTGSETPEEIYNRVRTCLTSKGKNLVFESNGTKVLDVTAPDAKGGPFPGSL